MIAVIGAGAWGTALANAMAQAEDVLLWAREPEVVEAVNGQHLNPQFLAGVPLNPRVRATADLAARVAHAAEMALQSVVQGFAGGQHAQGLLQQSFQFPVH